jgi:hypothetical protein
MDSGYYLAFGRGRRRFDGKLPRGWKQSSGKRTGGAVLEVSNISADETRMRARAVTALLLLYRTEISAALSGR